MIKVVKIECICGRQTIRECYHPKACEDGI